MEDRQKFIDWIDSALNASACANGSQPGSHPLRRLNRDEYAATIRDLLNIHVNAPHALPSDGAGGEGFDNAAETLFISPIYPANYLAAAKESLDYASKDPKSQAVFLIAEPDAAHTPEQAAKVILSRFVPRAFRRPARPGEVERYLAFFRAVQIRGQSFDRSILFALEAVLVSPNFLFHLEEPELGDYASVSSSNGSAHGNPGATSSPTRSSSPNNYDAELESAMSRCSFSRRSFPGIYPCSTLSIPDSRFSVSNENFRCSLVSPGRTSASRTTRAIPTNSANISAGWQ